MKKSIKNRMPGILIGTLLAIALMLFMAIVIKIQLLPTKYILLMGGIFLLFSVVIVLLTRDSRRQGSLITGCILTMLLLITLMIGTPYLTKALDTLGTITTKEREVAYVGVYVQKESSYEALTDLKDGNVGILKLQDRKNTDKALPQIQKEIGAVTVTEYVGLNNLADGLLQGEVDAILLNSAFLDVLAETEGYKEVPAQLKEIYQYKAETEIKKKKDETKDPENPIADRVFTLYISGIDSRDGVVDMTRSDVNILATVNVDTRQVLLVSTPRDYYVPLSISDGIPDKLTHAGIYGVDVSMETLEMLYDTEIDYYFRVNFSGFERIIDALGGVTVNSEMEFTSRDGHYYSEGENYLDGASALSFARERYAFEDGDRQRGKNQMAVIKAVIEKAMSPTLLLNYASIMDSVSGSFETSMPYDTIAELVRNQLDKGGDWKITSISVDGYNDSQITYSLGIELYVMVPDQATVDTAIAKINQVVNGEILE